MGLYLGPRYDYQVPRFSLEFWGIALYRVKALSILPWESKTYCFKAFYPTVVAQSMGHDLLSCSVWGLQVEEAPKTSYCSRIMQVDGPFHEDEGLQSIARQLINNAAATWLFISQTVKCLCCDTTVFCKSKLLLSWAMGDLDLPKSPN